jgi:hypothetical protein
MYRFLFVALLVFAVAGADVAYRAPQPVETAEYIGADGEGDLVRFNLQALTVDEDYVEGYGAADVLRIPGAGFLARTGGPDLPAVRRMVQVPNTGQVGLEVVSMETTPLGIYSVAPHQPSPTRSEGALPYRIDAELYSTPGLYPNSSVTVESVRILRDIRVAWLRYSPVQIDPTTGEARLVTSVTVRVTNEGGQGENELLRAAQGITRSYEHYYDEVLGYQGGSDYLDGCYMVISTQEGFDYCQDLIDWKRQKGYEVVYGLYPDEVGSTSGDIDDYIEEAYNTWDVPPEYILIIGDHNVVPTPTYSGHAADNLYGVIGSGSVPSIHMGRLTGSDTEDLPYISWKIHQYESNPYEPAESWYEHAISIGSTDFNDPEHSWEYAQIFMGAGMTVDYFCNEGGTPPTTSNVFDSIEEGKSLISFIGHGSFSSWSSPSCGSISDVQGLSNGHMLPWINSIACYNGQFDGGYCYAEAWMAEGTESDVKGAVGIMAATTASPVGQTDSLAEYTFRGYFEDDIWHMGPAVDYGKMKVEEFYGSGADDNNNMHMIFGCPETDIFTDTSPITELDATHDDQISVGTFEVIVEAGGSPVENALVGAVQDTVLLDGAYTNASGVATLDITEIPGTEDVTITATYHNRYPSVTTATVLESIEEGSSGIAGTFRLSAAAPNPFAAQTAIGFSVPSAGHVSLQVFDMSGRLVSTVHDGELAAGTHQMVWDGTTGSGQKVSEGVYLYRLATPEGTAVRSCVVMR